jgi:hypothetical protein
MEHREALDTANVLRDVRIFGRAGQLRLIVAEVHLHTSETSPSQAIRAASGSYIEAANSVRYALNAAWQRLLPFCSHKTPRQAQTGRTTLYQQKTSKYPVLNEFPRDQRVTGHGRFVLITQRSLFEIRLPATTSHQKTNAGPLRRPEGASADDHRAMKSRT